MGRLGVLASVLTVAALAATACGQQGAGSAGATPTSTVQSSHGPTGGSSPSTPPSSSVGPMLGPNKVALADVVPWAEVGQGWYLAAIDQGSKAAYGSMRTTAEILDLVDPLGGRYQLLKVKVDPRTRRGSFAIADWSLDGRTALLQFDKMSPRQRAVRVDLPKGAQTSVAVPMRYVAMMLAPDGAGVLATSLSNGPSATDFGRTERFAWNGTHTSLTDSAGLGVLASPDGASLVYGSRDNHVSGMKLVSAADGAVQQVLDTPKFCLPVRWWNPTNVLAWCEVHSESVLFLVPTDGGPASRLSLPHGKRSRDLGDLDARKIDSGLYLQAAGPCGVYFVAKQAADGTASPVSVPHAVGNVWLVGGSGSDLILRTSMTCDSDASRSALLRFDPTTRVERIMALLPVDEAFEDITAYDEPKGFSF